SGNRIATLNEGACTGGGRLDQALVEKESEVDGGLGIVKVVVPLGRLHVHEGIRDVDGRKILAEARSRFKDIVGHVALVIRYPVRIGLPGLKGVERLLVMVAVEDAYHVIRRQYWP